ncbi:MAG TPA: hypothetical protein VLG36_03865 [Candidatus Chromulinivoraceae bacterium]|nr:hypothetical protein [Candidatus Chromulinivoraceae bacterium]
MAQNTKNTTKKEQMEAVMELTRPIPSSQMSQDLKTAVLIVSVVANLFVLTAWIALQVTTQYDGQIANFLFTR